MSENLAPAVKEMHDVLVKDGIEGVAKILLSMPQVEMPVIHRFGPSLYIREISMPAGTMAIGHYQKYPHLNIMLKGRVKMLNENGTMTEMVAPLMFVGNPGRKIGYVLEDMVWQNIYATDETDVDKLEDWLIEKSPQWIASEEQRLAVNWLEHEEDRQDYFKFLTEIGYTEEMARREVDDDTDFISISTPKLQLGVSPISGKGLFASAHISAGEVISLARIGHKRTIAGRYANHSIKPNAEMVVGENGDMLLVATQEISGKRGGQLGDEITVNYRQAKQVALQANELLEMK
jgi:hypothetical protein